MEGHAVQPRRRWYRLHATTWFAMVFVAASLAFLNVLGDPNIPVEWVVFGWPFGFAKPLVADAADAQWGAPAVPSTEDPFGPITQPLPPGDVSDYPMTGGPGAGGAEANPADNPFGVPPRPPPARSDSLDDLFAPPVARPAPSNPFGPPVADPFGGPVVSQWLIVITDHWSNPAAERLYAARWPEEPGCRAQYEEGRQCGGCSFFAPFNHDWGLCCHPGSRHHLETVFEHFTCPSYTHEGWGPHSFTEEASFHCRCGGEPTD